jgi:hypothetical protein
MVRQNGFPMSQLTIVNSSQLFAAATAITAAGFLTVAPPAQAHPILPLAPACTQYSFPDGDWPIQINGEPYVIQTHHGANAAGRVLLNGKYMGSVTSGGIYKSSNGLTLVSFTITYNENVMERYAGNVEDDGLVHVGLVGSSSPTAPTWDSTRPLECNDAPAPAPAPAQQPAPPAAAAAARLGVAVNGPTTLPAGQSGTYTVTVSNPGELSAPVELFISFNGNLRQTGQPAPSGGFDCTVNNYAGGTSSVHCTVGQFGSKATANISVQGQGSAPGPGQLVVNINSSDPAAQFVQKSQQLNVTIT